jgi:hypothetical protein
MLGHLYNEHGDGMHSPEALVFKDLKANPLPRSSGCFVGRGRGLGAGRGGRGGRGQNPLGDPNNDVSTDEIMEEDEPTDSNRKRVAIQSTADGQ